MEFKDPNKYTDYLTAFWRRCVDNADVYASPIGGDVVNIFFDFATNLKRFDWQDCEISQHRKIQTDMRLAKRLGYVEGYDGKRI